MSFWNSLPARFSPVKRHIAQAGLSRSLSPRPLRVATATDLLQQGVPVEDNQYLHAGSGQRGFRIVESTRSRGIWWRGFRQYVEETSDVEPSPMEVGRCGFFESFTIVMPEKKEYNYTTWRYDPG